MAYALEETTCEVLPDPDPDCESAVSPSLDRDAALAKGKLGEVVLGALLLGRSANPPRALDFVFLRRGLHRYYLCSRRAPTTLQEFKDKLFDYTDAVVSVVQSFPKLSERHIRTSSCLGIVVAEAVEDGEVTDTEVLMPPSRTDGSLDFLAYDPSGRLVDRGAFATAAGGLAVAAAPYVCTSCHINQDVRPNRFDVPFPSMRRER